MPDLNLTELFRTNRYVGSDRIGDANQVALAMTTRLFDHDFRHPVPVGDHRADSLFSIPRVDSDRHRLRSPAGAAQFAQSIPIVNPLALPGMRSLSPADSR